MNCDYRGVITCIPTRNRAALASNAIRSVLDHSDCAVKVLVSDNSTDVSEINELTRFCDQLGDKRVRYIRPPRPLAASPHWNWVVEQALTNDVNHVTFLTDRMIFKPHELQTVYEIVAHYPDRILCYMHDMVEDHKQPVRLYQNHWTGNLYEIRSSQLLRLSAEAVMFDACCPRLLNCIVPRGILDSIAVRFVNVCDSIAPDWNFCYRALTVVDSLLFFDKSVLIHYASGESNGASQSRGVMTPAYRDFLANLGSKQLNFATPIPEVLTVWNTIFHEYCVVKQATGSPKFPELDLAKYMQTLSFGLNWLEDPAMRQQAREILASHGWKEQTTQNIAAAGEVRSRESLGTLFLFRRIGRLWRHFVSQPKGAGTKRVWLALRRLGIHPPDENRFVFSSTGDAIRYAIRCPRFPRKEWRLESTSPLPQGSIEPGGCVLVANPVEIERKERVAWWIDRVLGKYPLWRSWQRFLDRYVVWRFH